MPGPEKVPVALDPITLPEIEVIETSTEYAITVPLMWGEKDDIEVKVISAPESAQVRVRILGNSARNEVTLPVVPLRRAVHFGTGVFAPSARLNNGQLEVVVKKVEPDNEFHRSHRAGEGGHVTMGESK